jgi:hypothetical protein
VLSERTSWVDWADADIAIFFPAYTEEWRRRMDAIGVRLVAGQHSSKMMIQQYKEQSWEHLLTVARAHKIDYVVQYTEVPYSGPLVFRNESFAVYKVTN